jgi:hypothetical protein
MVHPVETGLELGSVEVVELEVIEVDPIVQTYADLDDLYDFDCRR